MKEMDESAVYAWATGYRNDYLVKVLEEAVTEFNILQTAYNQILKSEWVNHCSVLL